jgi:hypothetical protein
VATPAEDGGPAMCGHLVLPRVRAPTKQDLDLIGESSQMPQLPMAGLRTLLLRAMPHPHGGPGMSIAQCLQWVIRPS